MINPLMKSPRKPPILSFVTTDQEIQKCAYFLRQEEGRPAGRDVDRSLSAKELVRRYVSDSRICPGPCRRLAA